MKTKDNQLCHYKSTSKILSTKYQVGSIYIHQIHRQMLIKKYMIGHNAGFVLNRKSDGSLQVRVGYVQI